jgi:hypothetical protein
MPGPVSDSYEAPICACGRFKRVHDWPSGTITAEPGVEGCDGFRQVAFDDTELGKAMDAFLNQIEDCGCYKPGPDNAVECGLRVDERNPFAVRRAESGNYDNEEVCRCDCHADDLEDRAA